ncbi:MAG: glycosyltransferase [Planctomycetota bacterium]|nr:MAG: glycosyltransferase [Planctomycetota bacterium]
MPPAARAAAAVVTVSAATARRLRALLPEADLILAPNGSDHLPASSPAPGCFLLAPGPWARHKGLATLLAGWRLLGRNRPRLILTGRPGRRLPPGVEAVQPDDRGLSALLAGAAAVVRPSAFEGFDLPLAEALAAGAPVAASDIPVHRELAGEEAEWFQPGDDEGLATALDRILTTGDDPAARLRRRRRAARFRWAESARILDQALRRLNLAPPSGADSGSPV